MLPRFVFVYAILAVLMSLSSTGLAQENTEEFKDTRSTDGVLLPSPSITDVNDSTALATNPSKLAMLDSWNFAYVGAWLLDQDHLAGQGHGFFFGFPIGPIAIGLGTEALTPPDAVRKWQGLDDRARFSLGIAFNFRRAVAFGLAYRTFWGYDLGDIHCLDLSLTVHPINYVSLAFVAKDINAPHIYHNSNERAPRRFNVGLTLRPLGNDRLSIGGELNYIFGQEFTRTDVTTLLSGMIVDGITLRGRFGVGGIRDDNFESGYFVDGSIVFALPHFGVGASFHGQVYPTSKSDYQGTTWSATFYGDDAPSINLPRQIRATHAVLVEITKRMDSYRLTRLADFFERIKRDPGADLVIFKPSAKTISLAHAEEVRRRINDLKASDRKVVCYLAEATGPVYLACQSADQIWINPAGSVRFAGLSMHRLYFRNLFNKIGVEADIVRIGEYKSAPEMFTQTGPSDASVRQTDRYLNTVYYNILDKLAADRNLADVESARNVVEQGPFTASEALAHSLVDKIVPADALAEDLQDYLGKLVYIDERYGKAPERHRRYIDSPAVAVVHINGDIIDGESVHIPFFNIRMTGAKTVTKLLRTLKQDRRIHAVVLRINSPGGSALASDMIWREVMALRDVKPVIASLGPVAASGAYYIASAADEIYAEASTVTGSIGIYYGKANLQGLMGKIGVDIATFKRGAHADAESWTRPYTKEERKHLTHQITEFYNMFKDKVAEGRGRGFNRDIVEKLGQGRIWSGIDAQHQLLVDNLGGYGEALARARVLGGVRPDIRVFHYPDPRPNFIKRMFTSLRSMVSEPNPFEMLVSMAGIKQTLKSVFPFAMADSGAPRARLPFVIVQD